MDGPRESGRQDDRKDEEVIDLTQVVNDEDDDIIELDTVAEPPEPAVAAGEAGVIDLLETVDAKPTPQQDAQAASDAAATLPLHLREEQIEATLERVIEKVYAQKIEHMLTQSVAETVKREIEKIKNEILEGGDDTSA